MRERYQVSSLRQSNVCFCWVSYIVHKSWKVLSNNLSCFSQILLFINFSTEGQIYNKKEKSGKKFTLNEIHLTFKNPLRILKNHKEPHKPYKKIAKNLNKHLKAT